MIGSSQITITNVENGKGIKSSAVTYQGGTSATIPPTDDTGWTEAIPELDTGEYLWTRTVITFTDDTSTASYSVSSVGKGSGEIISVSDMTVQYCVSTSSLEVDSSAVWSTDTPTDTENKYVWMRTLTTYSNGKTSTSNPVCLTKTKGKDIVSITPQYYKSTSNTIQTGGSWSTEMPEWEKDTYLWIRNEVVYANPTTTDYTNPVLDKTWDAISEVATQVIETKTSVSEVEAKVDANAKTIETQVSTIETIQSDITTINTDVSGLKQDSSSISTSVESLKDTIANDYTKTEDMKSLIEQSAEGVKTTVSETYVAKDTYNSKISELETTASGIEARVSTSEGDIATLKTTAGSIQTNVQNNANNISELQQTANNLKNTVAQKEDAHINSFHYIRDYLGQSSVGDGYKYWSMIQIFRDEEGDISPDIAEGLVPYSNVQVSDLEAYTDNNMETCAYTTEEDENGYAYLELDLGEEVLNITAIKVIHTTDGCQFQHKLKVSRDGEAWYTIYDSDIQGMYTETWEGMTHTLTSAYTLTKLTQVTQTADGINAEIVAARKGKTSLKLALDGIETSVSTVDGKVSTLQQTVDGINTSVTNAQGDISTLQQRADGFDTSISDANSNISTLQQRADGFDTSISNAQGDITTLQGRADGFDTSISDANGNISTLQQSVSDINTSVLNAQGDITTLKQTDKRLSASIQNSANNITNITATVNGVSTRVDNLSTSQTAMSQDAESLKVVIAKMGGNVGTSEDISTIMKINENGLAVSGESSNGLITNKTVIDKESLKGYYNPLGLDDDTLNDEDIVFQIDEDVVKTKRLYAEKGCDFYTIKAVPVTLTSPNTNGLIFIKSVISK